MLRAQASAGTSLNRGLDSSSGIPRALHQMERIAPDHARYHSSHPPVAAAGTSAAVAAAAVSTRRKFPGMAGQSARGGGTKGARFLPQGCEAPAGGVDEVSTSGVYL